MGLLYLECQINKTDISKILNMFISIPALHQYDIAIIWPCGVVVNILAFGASVSGSNPLRAAQKYLLP